MTPALASAFDAHPAPARDRLLALHHLIHAVAARIDGLDRLEESLKWGQPSYAPPPKLGVSIRLGRVKSGAPALFVHCGTSLIADFTAVEGREVRVEGKRALLADGLDDACISRFIRAALTYRAQPIS